MFIAPAYSAPGTCQLPGRPLGIVGGGQDRVISAELEGPRGALATRITFEAGTPCFRRGHRGPERRDWLKSQYLQPPTLTGKQLSPIGSWGVDGVEGPWGGALGNESGPRG